MSRTYKVFHAIVKIEENSIQSNLKNILTRKEADVIESLLLALSEAGIDLAVEQTEAALMACVEALGNN
jgi:hypothetical protein